MINEEKEQKEVSNNLKLIAKSSIIVFIGIFISKLFTIVYRVIVGRYFGPEVYGLFSLLLMLEGLVLSVALLGFSQGILRQLTLYRGRKQYTYLRYLFKKTTIILFFSGIISSVIIFFLSNYLAVEIFKNSELTFFFKVFSISIPILIFSELFLASLMAFEKIKAYSFIQNIFQSGVKVILLLVFIFIGLNSSAVVFSYVFGIILTFFLAYIYSKRHLSILFGESNLKKDVRKKITLELFSYSWPLIFTGLMGGILYWIDSFLIGYFKGVFEVGIYNAALPILSIMILSSQLFLKLLYPLMIKEYSKRNFDTIKEMSKQVGKWIFLLNFPLCILIMLFPGAILSVLFGKEYIFAANALRILSIGALVNSVFLVSNHLLLMAGKSKTIFLSTTITGLLNLVLNLILIPMPKIFGLDNSLGINGAAIATSISLIFFNLFLMISAKKCTSIIPIRRKMARIVLVTLLPGVLLWAISNFFPINMLTMILSVSLFLLLYIILLFFTKCLDKNDLMIFNLIKSKAKKSFFNGNSIKVPGASP